MRAEAKEMRTTVPDTATVLDHLEHHFRRLLRRATTHADHVLVVRQPWFEKDYTPEEEAHFWHGGLGMPWNETVSGYYSPEGINPLLGLLESSVAHLAAT